MSCSELLAPGTELVRQDGLSSIFTQRQPVDM